MHIMAEILMKDCKVDMTEMKFVEDYERNAAITAFVQIWKKSIPGCRLNNKNTGRFFLTWMVVNMEHFE